MLESLGVEVVNGLAAAVGAGVVGILGWLCGKLWSLLRHETTSMKQATLNNTVALEKAMEHFEGHIQRDEELHRGMMRELGEMKGYLAGRSGAKFG